MTTTRLGGRSLLVALGIALAVPAVVDADAGICTAIKLRALGRAVKARALCEAHAHLDPEPGPYCAEVLDRATRRLARAFARADEMGPCPGTDADLRPIAYSDCIHYIGVDGPCAAAVVKAAGARIARMLACHARGARAGEPPSPGCLEDADRRLVAKLAAADRHGPCSGGFDHVAQFGDHCVGRMTDGLECGNGVVDPGEQCDGQSYCSTPDCRVVVTVCCDFGGICSTGPIEYGGKCQAFGGTLHLGQCVPNGSPCPIPDSSCTPGTCVDPPVAAHSVCCQSPGSCAATVVNSEGEEAYALYGCAQMGAQGVFGTCGPTGTCVPG
jgi:hypothetical protein